MSGVDAAVSSVPLRLAHTRTHSPIPATQSHSITTTLSIAQPPNHAAKLRPPPASEASLSFARAQERLMQNVARLELVCATRLPTNGPAHDFEPRPRPLERPIFRISITTCARLDRHRRLGIVPCALRWTKDAGDDRQTGRGSYFGTPCSETSYQ